MEINFKTMFNYWYLKYDKYSLFFFYFAVISFWWPNKKKTRKSDLWEKKIINIVDTAADGCGEKWIHFCRFKEHKMLLRSQIFAVGYYKSLRIALCFFFFSFQWYPKSLLHTLPRIIVPKLVSQMKKVWP